MVHVVILWLIKKATVMFFPHSSLHCFSPLRLSLHSGQVAHQAGAYPGFRSMKRLRVFLLPPGWDASPSQGYPPPPPALNSPVYTHLYTWVERGTVRVKCLAQEHNTMSPARARTWSGRSGVERANHEATVPPTIKPPSHH